MTSQLEHLAQELFPDGGGLIGNVKFFMGFSRGITADDLAGQLASANRQIASGEATLLHDVDGEL